MTLKRLEKSTCRTCGGEIGLYYDDDYVSLFRTNSSAKWLHESSLSRNCSAPSIARPVEGVREKGIPDSDVTTTVTMFGGTYVCRLTHLPSGVIADSDHEPSMGEAKKSAMARLIEKVSALEDPRL